MTPAVSITNTVGVCSQCKGGMKKLTYEIYLLRIEVFRQEGSPSENLAALVLWDLVKLCANQQQRHWVLSKLLSVIVTAEERALNSSVFNIQLLCK